MMLIAERSIPTGTWHVQPRETLNDFIQNRRVKRLQCYSVEGFCSKISSGGSLEKVVGPVFVCMSVCTSIFASGARTAGRSGRANIHSMRRNGKKTMVTVSDRSAARGTWHV